MMSGIRNRAMLMDEFEIMLLMLCSIYQITNITQRFIFFLQLEMSGPLQHYRIKYSSELPKC